MEKFREQIRRNAVALISLSIAVTSLVYTGWRNETSEGQRNTREAAFRVLEELGEIQEVVLYRAYFAPADEAEAGRLRVAGYGSVILIHDLMTTLPQPAPDVAERLQVLWHSEVDALSSGANSEAAIAANNALSDLIDEARASVKQIIQELD